MNRQPVLMDPRTSLPGEQAPERTSKIVWGFVLLGVLTLLVGGGIAWFTVNGGRSTALNVPGKEGKSADPSNLHRAVAIAFVDLEHGVTPLMPERLGRVVAVMVNENQVVEKGQELLKIDDEVARKQLEEAETALQGAILTERQAQNLVKKHIAGMSAQEEMIGVREAEVSVAQTTLTGMRKAWRDRKGVTEEEVSVAEKNVEKARRGVAAEKAKLSLIQAEDPQLAVEAAKLQIKAKQQQVEKAKADVARYVLRAPSKGRILRSMVTVGEVMGGNPFSKPALEFWPDGESVIVRAEVEQEFVGMIRESMKATVTDYDTGNVSWQGTVSRIGGWISQRRSRTAEPLSFNDVRTLETIIKLDTDPQYPLKIGQRVRVVLEK